MEGWAFFAAFGLKSRSEGVFFFGAQISFFGNHFFVPLINKYDTLLIVKSSSTLPNRHTIKQKGRTRTVSVPMELVSDAKTWTRTYKHLKLLIRQVTRHSLALIHRHVANQRAAKRSLALTRRSRRKPS